LTLEHEKPLESSYPSFSILIEWENVRFNELQIAKRMLQNVAKQINDISDNLSSSPEIIILYNKEVTKGYKIDQFVRDALESSLLKIKLKIISTPNLNYYQQRNYGAELCSNEILVFIDCDVVPDDGWLSNLLLPFNDPEMSAVGGLNYVDPVSSTEKGFSLVWIMPPKNDTEGKTAQLSIYVPDNVAFRRKVFLANKFPKSSSFRGAIVEHCNMLQNKGYKIIRQPKAKVEHASYNGTRHLVVRSLCEGHDKYLAWRGLHDHYLKNSPKQKHSIIKFFREKISLYKERKKYLNVSTKDKVGIFYVGSIYYGFLAVGFFLTLINPRIIEGSIKI